MAAATYDLVLRFAGPYDGELITEECVEAQSAFSAQRHAQVVLAESLTLSHLAAPATQRSAGLAMDHLRALCRHTRRFAGLH